ncbi:hypothetical protein EXIGLDRAFT_758651 [Exidia glandulosa HHB12029]|uniref:20S-pre-rRNA D-site endonuclease NOB1 n=1 Tax=Exidia glandulosa HHB12029 TaxID=1314781 RepID=A0A165R1C5_EXIGL|nr:hypothetical protein EXIGLDRAFT_758651 [Exidia glandulosa HHB12029]
MPNASQPAVINLVLDAGPLLAQTQLRGVAQNYYTVPHVISELRDKSAREHLDRLALVAGINIVTRNPDTASLLKVVACAKRSGDYSVLSQADLAVLALTLSLHEKAAATAAKTEEQSVPESAPPDVQSEENSVDELAKTLEASQVDAEKESEPVEQLDNVEEVTDSEDDSKDEDDESDDGEGEWITPDNVAKHKSRALDLLPANDSGEAQKTVPVGCMTADFAMQNVLLHLGLNLLDVEGRRISTVKTWVLRCHACFKLCKDNTKKFCPTCGNATLLRTSITTKAPETPGGQPVVQVHLKRNFQYRNRGSKYSIPAPKPGSSKKGGGEGLILREDQQEWQRAVRHDEVRREKDERRMLRALKETESNSAGIKVGAWNDPDWVPEMLVVGSGGKGRSMRDGMPAIGYGRKNPNERRRKR